MSNKITQNMNLRPNFKLAINLKKLYSLLPSNGYKTLSLPEEKLNMTRHYPPLSQEWKDNLCGYNEDFVKNSTSKNLMANRIIHSYFNITSNQRKPRKTKRSRSLLKLNSGPQLFLSAANVKETNDKAVVTVYIFGRENRVQLRKFIKLSQFIISKRSKKLNTMLKSSRINSTFENEPLNNKFKKKILMKSKKGPLQDKLYKMKQIYGKQSRFVKRLRSNLKLSPAEGIFKGITEKRSKLKLINNYFWKNLQYMGSSYSLRWFFIGNLMFKDKSFFLFAKWILRTKLNLETEVEVIKKTVKDRKNRNGKQKKILESVKLKLYKIVSGPASDKNNGTGEHTKVNFSAFTMEKKKNKNQNENENGESKSFVTYKEEFVRDIFLRKLVMDFSMREELIGEKIILALRKYIEEKCIRKSESFTDIHPKKLISSSLKQVKAITPNRYLEASDNLYGSLLNKLKFDSNFVFLLKTLLNNVYHKKIELNLINLKYLYLNSDILIKSIIVKLRGQKSSVRGVFFKSLAAGKIAKMSYKNLFTNKNKNRPFKYKLDSFKNYNYPEIVSFKNSNSNVELFNDLNQHVDTWSNKVNNNMVNTYIGNDLNAIKYKWITGIRLEARGRLSKMSGASRARSCLKYKGSLKNLDYLNTFDNKLSSSLLLKNENTPNVQYTYKSSERPIGTFGVKGWLSSN